MAIGSTTASNPVSTGNVDPMAEQNKAIKQQNAQNQQAWQSQQPMIEGNQQANFVPLNKNAYNVQNQTMNTTQGNDAVLSKLQGTVLSQQPSSVMPLLQKQTANYLNDPSLGYNPAANKQMQLEQFDRQNSQAMEAARQQLGDTSQSGQLQNEFLKNVLTNTANRGDLSRKIDTEAAQQNQQNLLNALGAGRAQVATENETNTSGINNLVAARGAAEGERAQTQSDAQQMAVLEKTFGQDMAKLVATQDWQGAQNLLNHDFELARQTKDINAQSSIIDRQLALDKWKQENGQEFTAQQNAINNALQLTLKDKDLVMQTSLMELKGKIDAGQLTTQQDFQAVQADLERKQKEYLQKGEWQNALDVVQQKGVIEAAAQKSQQEFQAAESKANRTWQSAERVSTEDYDKAKQVIEYNSQTALKNQDIQAQKDLKDQQAKIDLKMKTQDLNDTQKKMYLQSQLDNAKLDKDVDRQRQILGFQAANDFAKMDKQYGHDVAMSRLNSDLKIAESSQDFEHTKILQQEKFAQDAIEAAKDRALKQAEIDLQAKGVDMQALNQQYDLLQKEVDAGRADPSTLNTFITGVMGKAGVKVQQPDPEAERKAGEKKYQGMLDQYATSHPDMVDPITKKIKPEGQKAFNEFFNNATYGEQTTAQKQEKEMAGYLKEEDVNSAQVGDKFKLQTNSAKDISGNSIPAGNYHVVNGAVTTGNKFFGTQKTTDHYYLVDNNDPNKKYEVRKNEGRTQGNIVSNLWAG